MLRFRFMSATAIVTIFAALVWLDYAWNFGLPGLWLAPLLAALGIGGAYEMLGWLDGQASRPASWVVHVGVQATLLGSMAPLVYQLFTGDPYPAACPMGRVGWPLVGLAFGIGVALLNEFRQYKHPGGIIQRLAFSCLIMVYIGGLLCFFSALRLFGNNAWGMAALLSMVIVVKSSDIGAYSFGRLLGRNKMAPLLSPGKTIEGAIGGVLLACLTSWLVFTFLVPLIVTTDPAPWWRAALYGAILAVLGIIGDLAESLMKRDSGKKDSGSFVPGLGGVLDIADSLLLAAPAAYILWVIGLVGPGT